LEIKSRLYNNLKAAALWSISLVSLPLAAQDANDLATLAGFQIPGLDSVTIDGATIGSGFFHGKLTQLIPTGGDPSLAPTVAGFKESGQTDYTVVIQFDPFSLDDYVDAFKNTPAADVLFSNARLFVVPAGNGQSGATVPAEVSDIVGESVLDLVEGTRVTATAALTDSVNEWIDGLGLPVSALPLNGTIPPGVFSGQLSADDVRPLVDLHLTIDRSSATWLSGATFTEDLDLSVKGSDTGWDVAIATGLEFALGAHQVSLDSVSVVSAGGETTVSALFADGQGLTVESLLGTSVPGLSSLSVDGVTIGSGYIEGDISFVGENWTVLFANPDTVRVLALWPADDLKLSTLIDAAANTVLDEFEMKGPTLIHATPVTETTVVLPTPLSDRIGKDELALISGITLEALADVVAGSELESLLSAAGLASAQGLSLGGSLDPRVLTNPIALPDIDLAFPLPSIVIEGAPDSMSTSNDHLNVGVGDGSLFSRIGMTVHLAGTGIHSTPPIIATFADSGSIKKLSGTTSADSAWVAPFDIDWLTLSDVGIDAEFEDGSPTFFKLTGLTDLAKGKPSEVTGLDVEMAFSSDNWSLKLLDADIPLSAIVRHVDLSVGNQGHVTVRDIEVSSDAFAGKGWTDPADTLSMVAFRVDSEWTLALKRTSLGLADLITPFVTDTTGLSVLDDIVFEPVATVISPNGLAVSTGDLPQIAQDQLSATFGTAEIRINGFGLVGGWQASSLPETESRALSDVGMDTTQALTVSGSVGAAGVNVGAGIPPITIPPGLAQMGLPKQHPHTQFFIDYSSDPLQGLSFGIALDSLNIPLGANSDSVQSKVSQTGVPVMERVAFSVGEEGLTLETTMDAAGWKDAMGIGGLTLTSGTLDLSVSTIGAGRIELDAVTQIGTRDLRLDGEVSMVDGLMTSLFLGGAVDTLMLTDVLALSNSARTAAGDTAMSTSFPTARLDSVSVAFATFDPPVPDSVLAVYDLDKSGGIHVQGTLYLFSDTEPWGSMNVTVAGDGFQATGDIREITIGAVTIDNGLLDVYARVQPDSLRPPHFKIGGEIEDSSSVFAKDTKVYLSLSPARMELDFQETGARLASGPFDFEFGAFIDLPVPNVTNLNEMGDFDMGFDAVLDSTDLNTWLKGDGLNTVTGVVNRTGAAVSAVGDTLRKWQAYVDTTLSDSIRLAIQQVEAQKANTDARIAALQSKIQDDSVYVESKRALLATYTTHSCTETRKVCVGYKYEWSERKFVCTKHKRVPDVRKRLRCEADNVKNLALKSATEALIDGGEASLNAARDALEAIQSLNDAIPDSLDPHVAALVLEQHAAQLSLDAALQADSLAQGAVNAVESALNIYSEVANSVSYNSLKVSGSLNGATGQAPILLTLDYEIDHDGFSLPLITEVPIRLDSLAYTIDNVKVMALKLASQGISMANASGESSKIPGVIENLVKTQYREKAATVASRTQDVQTAAGVDSTDIAAVSDSTVALGDANALSAQTDSLHVRRQASADTLISIRRERFRGRHDALRTQLANFLFTDIGIHRRWTQWRVRDIDGSLPDGNIVPRSTDRSFIGPHSIAVDANGDWNFQIDTTTPSQTVGQDSVSLALYLSEVQAGPGDQINLSVNGIHIVDLLQGPVQIGSPNWQPIVAPLPPNTESVSAIQLSGSLNGRLHIDGFELIREGGSLQPPQNSGPLTYVIFSECDQPAPVSQAAFATTEHDGPVQEGSCSIATTTSSPWDLTHRFGEHVGGVSGGNLRFFVHPGSVIPGTGDAFNVEMDVSTDPRLTKVSSVSARPSVDLISEGLLDVSKQGWQEVNIPLDAFGVEDVVGSLLFTGDLSGTFYVDEVMLELTQPPILNPEQVAPLLPAIFGVHQSYPNPFNLSTTFRYDLPQSASVEISIYNVLGQRVDRLELGLQPAGFHAVQWDGVDQRGRTVGSGVYVYRIEAGADKATGKMVLLK
jgi:hypothetical protein